MWYISLAMKVILLRDVAKIGRKGAVVEVPSGYAQNQLIPKGQAKPATPENLKAVERGHTVAAAANQAAIERFIEAKHQLQNTALVIDGQKSDHGHLFAAIKPVVIVSAANNANISLEENWLYIPSPIKTTGEHQLELRYKDQKASFKINIK